MSNIIRKAVQGREDRVAVDSLLSFQASKQRYVDCGVQQALMAAIDHDKSFSMSFFLAPLVTETVTRSVISISKNINNTGHYSGLQLNMNYSLSRNAYRIFFYFFQKTDAAYSYKSWVTDYIFRANALHHIVYNYTSGTGMEIYVNGKKETLTLNLDYGTITGSIYTVPDITTAFGAKVTDGVSSNWPDMLFNHLSVFNRTLTEAELQGIHHLGGVLPSSTHIACVAHYPLQDNYSRTVLDVVEQYNYAKFANESNGSFNTDINSWSIYQAGSATGILRHSATDGAAEIEATAPGGSTSGEIGIQQSNLVVGESYTVSFDLRLVAATAQKKFYCYLGTALVGTFYINHDDLTWRTRTVTGTVSGNTALKLVIANNPSQPISAGDVVQFDNVIVRHNTNPQLTAQYGELINYTDSELGLVNQSTQTAWNDFYSKATKLDKLLYHAVASNQYAENVNGNVGAVVNNLKDFTISFSASLPKGNPAGGKRIHFLSQGSITVDSNGWALSLIPQGNVAGHVQFLLGFRQNGGGDDNKYVYIYGYVPTTIFSTLRHVAVTYQASGRVAYVYIDKIKYALNQEWTGTGFNHTLTSQSNDPVYVAKARQALENQKDTIVAHSIFYNRVLTESEVTEIYKNDGVPPESTYAAIVAHYEPDTAALKMTDLVEQYNGAKGASPLTAQHGSLVNYTGTETRLLEQKSLLPSLHNALQFNGADGGQYVRALNVPLAGTSFTIVIAFKTPDRFRDDYKDALCTVLDSANAPILAIYGLDVNLYGMNVGAKDCIAVWSGNSNVLESHNITYGEWQLMALRVPESFASADLYQNGHALPCARATTWAGFSGNNTVEIGADSRLSNRRFKGGIGFFGITQQVLTNKQLLEIANNALGKQPQKCWNIDWKVLPNFNRIIDNTANVAGQYLLEDLSGKNHTIEAVNYTSAQINAEDTARTALKPINYLRQDFYHLVRKGMYSDGVNQRLSTTDNLSLGDGTQSFSMRYWAAITRKIDNSHFLENNVTDPRISIAHRIVSNDTFLLLYFGVSGRLGAIEVMYDDYTLKYDNKLNYYGVDRITNNSANWIAISADQRIIPTAGQVTYNSLVETDVLAMANPHFFAGVNWGTQYNVKGTTTGFMLFQPALTEAQNNWLYNKGKGNDPTGMEAKAMGIGIAGIDTIGANNITTLLTRYMTFEKLYTSTNEYIREHVTINNTYAQLYNYAVTDAKIVHLP